MPSRSPEAVKRHYKEYQSKPLQKKRRAMRNKARREAIAAGEAKKGDGKDVHHVKPLSKGGSNSKSNRKVISRKKNRGYARTKTNKPK